MYPTPASKHGESSPLDLSRRHLLRPADSTAIAELLLLSQPSLASGQQQAFVGSYRRNSTMGYSGAPPSNPTQENAPMATKHPLVSSLLKATKKGDKPGLPTPLNNIPIHSSPYLSNSKLLKDKSSVNQCANGYAQSSPITIPTYSPSTQLHFPPHSSSSHHNPKQLKHRQQLQQNSVSHLRNALVQKSIVNGNYPDYVQNFPANHRTSNGYPSRASSENDSKIASKPLLAKHQTSCACFYLGTSASCPLHGGGPPSASQSKKSHPFNNSLLNPPVLGSFISGPSNIEAGLPSKQLHIPTSASYESMSGVSQNGFSNVLWNNSNNNVQVPSVPFSHSSAVTPGMEFQRQQAQKVTGETPSQITLYNAADFSILVRAAKDLGSVKDESQKYNNVLNTSQPHSLLNGISPSMVKDPKQQVQGNSSSEPELVAPPFLEAVRPEGLLNPTRACTSPLSPPQLTAAVPTSIPDRQVKLSQLSSMLSNASSQDVSHQDQTENTFTEEDLSSHQLSSISSERKSESSSENQNESSAMGETPSNNCSNSFSRCSILSPKSKEELGIKSDSDFNTKADLKRKRSLLGCLASSKGYISSVKKVKTSTNLFVDPKNLDREERALQLAMYRFEELEKDSPPCSPGEDPQPVSESPSDLRSHYRTRVYTKRKLNQNNKYVYKRYNKNAAYEEELVKEARRLSELRARKRLKNRLADRACKKAKKEDAFGSDEREEEGSEKADDEDCIPLKETQTPWRRRRRFHQRKSGMDMINRKRKSKTSESKPRKSLVERHERKYKMEAGSGGQMVSEADLKRFIVNKALGETVLHRSARQGYRDLVGLCLRTHYCQVSARDNAGFTPLHECCVRKGHLAIARLLLQYGADPNASANGGIRPLHDAVENDLLEIVRLLLSFGADPMLATYAGLTPLKLAKSKAMTTLLQGYMADSNGEPFKLWQFYGTSKCLEPEDSGFNVFEDVPSDQDDPQDDGFIFEVSEQPHLATFKIQLPGQSLPTNCVRLNEVLSQTGLADQCNLEAQHPEVCVVEVPRHEFEAGATCNQLLTGTRLDTLLAPTPPGPVSLVPMDAALRRLLNIQTIVLR